MTPVSVPPVGRPTTLKRSRYVSCYLPARHARGRTWQPCAIRTLIAHRRLQPGIAFGYDRDQPALFVSDLFLPNIDPGARALPRIRKSPSLRYGGALRRVHNLLVVQPANA